MPNSKLSTKDEIDLLTDSTGKGSREREMDGGDYGISHSGKGGADDIL